MLLADSSFSGLFISLCLLSFHVLMPPVPTLVSPNIFKILTYPEAVALISVLVSTITMETSLRYNGDAKSLRIHAKQKLLIDSDTFLQVRGELDTKHGGPTYLSAMLRRFYNPPQLAATLGVGMQFDKRDKLGYVVRGKLGFPVTSNDSVRLSVKGRCDVDKDLKQRKSKGAAEFSWCVLNFQKDQDVRLKVGYDIVDQVPYMQIRENNWTLNADAKGRWNIRYDL